MRTPFNRRETLQKFQCPPINRAASIASHRSRKMFTGFLMKAATAILQNDSTLASDCYHVTAGMSQRLRKTSFWNLDRMFLYNIILFIRPSSHTLLILPIPPHTVESWPGEIPHWCFYSLQTYFIFKMLRYTYYLIKDETS